MTEHYYTCGTCKEQLCDYLGNCKNCLATGKQKEVINPDL